MHNDMGRAAMDRDAAVADQTPRDIVPVAA
jgi:hypothetical protein